jgi:hypothetical protein
MKMSNPYVSRGPVQNSQMFFGRVHELQEIAAFLQGNQSVSIVGPRKIGKTSLLFHLMRPTTWPQLAGVELTADYLFTYLDCEVLGEGSHEEIFGQFAAEMAAALEARQLPLEPALEKAVENPSRLAFETAVRRLNQRNLRVVLILDEFERLSTNPSLNINFFNALRSAAGRYQLTFLTASASPLIQLTYSGKSREILSSPFFNIFAQQFLGLLPEVEARQLIAAPFEAAGKTMPAQTADTLYRLAGGHPFCLQIFCFHAYDAPNQVDDIRQRAMRELQAHFEYYWRNLGRLEQETLVNLPTVLAQLAQDATLAHILRDLTHKCLLIPEGKGYRYASQGWADFVQAQAEQSPAVAAGSRQGTLSGVTLGPYQFQELLARGGMAEVYKGLHVRLGRPVAIKVLPQQLAGEGDFRRRFEQEARAVAALKHPNIVQVFDFGNLDETCYLVMEYVDGKDLTYYLQERPGPLPLAEALPILRNIASALDYAHIQGVIHRDIKPSNILLEIATVLHPSQSPYRAILSDFGIAKLLSSSAATTGTGMIGTLDYMAPEQIQSAGTVDSSADIYGLGVLAYRVLTGVLPFSSDNPGEVLAGHLYRPVPDPRSFAPNLPDYCAAALQRALAKEPDKRFATASQLVAELAI